MISFSWLGTLVCSKWFPAWPRQMVDENDRSIVLRLFPFMRSVMIIDCVHYMCHTPVSTSLVLPLPKLALLVCCRLLKIFLSFVFWLQSQFIKVLEDMSLEAVWRQLSPAQPSNVSWQYSCEQFFVHRFRLALSSVRQFTNLFRTVDWFYFSLVRFSTNWQAFLLVFLPRSVSMTP